MDCCVALRSDVRVIATTLENNDFALSIKRNGQYKADCFLLLLIG